MSTAKCRVGACVATALGAMVLASSVTASIVHAQRAELQRSIQRRILDNGLEVIVVENHGIPPDIEVEYDPKSVAAGHDPQLDRAVQYVMEQLKEHPLPTYPKPAYPNYHEHDGLAVH